MNVADGFLEHARHAPDRPAVVLDGRSTTYRELAGDIGTAAAALRAYRRHDGDRIGLLLPPGVAFLEAFLAVAHAGMAAMVLQDGWSDRELEAALGIGRPALVVTAPPSADRLRPAIGVPQVVVIDGRIGNALRPPDGPASSGGRGARGDAADGEDERRPFYVGFTSGTTGRPKGFVRHHSSWLRSFDAATEVFGIGTGDRLLVPGPLDQSLFLFAAIHGLSVGASVHLQRRFAPRTTLQAMATGQATAAYVVPAMLDGLVRAAEHDRIRLPHVTAVICSGARWPALPDRRLRDVFPAATTFEFYGASELSFVSVRRHGDGDPPTSVGRPFPGVEVAVRRDDGSSAAVDEPGRLWVRSDLLFTGYLDDTDREERDGDGWVTVGDVGSIDPQGRIHLVGRDGTMLICGGLNVYPEEVESILLELPEVAEAVVVGLPHVRWGDQLCAVLRWEDGARATRARLRAHCRARLARGKRPHRWLAVDELPRTASGKLARTALADGLRRGVVAAEELS